MSAASLRIEHEAGEGFPESAAALDRLASAMTALSVTTISGPGLSARNLVKPGQESYRRPRRAG
jgi:hypothetical protein